MRQANLLKIAAMLVAAPRYVGLMLYLSGFAFTGWFLDALHVAEGVAGLSLAVLEGFALAYILSRRQLGFSRADKTLVLSVVALLLLLLPLCATPYLLYLFDGSRLFAPQQNEFVGPVLLKFLWVAGSVLMPVLVIVGVALVEKDPVDVELLNAERQALLQQKLAEIEAQTEQRVLQFKLLAQQARAAHRTKQQQVQKEAEQNLSKDFVCPECGAAFESNRALAGHIGHCKARANGQQKEAVEVVG
ncbi:MAG: hypothetical protein JXM69_14275 [Anaerolineae bacterium]|nr:hypothetical protein [Anaerolineae bacterium]